MNKKILVIVGSPRENGNTNAMVKAFEKAARGRGFIVETFDATKATFNGCHACGACYKTRKACSFDDDFNIVAPKILEAEGVVFAMPVYWYSIPSQIKGLIDKLFSFQIGQKDYKRKECALISCCEEKDLSVFDGVRYPMEKTAALLEWKVVGEVLIPGVLNIGDIEKTDGEEQAKVLAEKF